MKKITTNKYYFENADIKRFNKTLKEKNITKTEFAKRCGITRTQLYNILNGEFAASKKFIKEFENIDK